MGVVLSLFILLESTMRMLLVVTFSEAFILCNLLEVLISRTCHLRKMTEGSTCTYTAGINLSLSFSLEISSNVVPWQRGALVHPHHRATIHIYVSFAGEKPTVYIINKFMYLFSRKTIATNKCNISICYLYFTRNSALILSFSCFLLLLYK